MRKWLIVFLLYYFSGYFIAAAKEPVKGFSEKKSSQAVKFRGGGICASATSQIDQEINNVRARLAGGGDSWFSGRYIVPKVYPGTGQQEVSSLYAAAVWMGGFDPNGVLKLACQDYRTSTTEEFWPGPLGANGLTDADQCAQWNRHFKVLGAETRQHLALFRSGHYTADQIPKSLKGWPAKGNPYFSEVWGFNLPSTPQGLAGFFNMDDDPNYDPLKGDFPSLEIRGCQPDRFPDEMVFWIYNDQGGGAQHGNTKGEAMQVEVQVQAFAYQSTDALNDMTFQRFKIINRATDLIDSCFFAMWIDPDLGCQMDDYIGCDSTRSLMYCYNMDAVDGDDCLCGDVPGYCDKIPIIGVDYFRGPLDTAGTELGMTSFIYYNNGDLPGQPGTIDPETPIQFYRYLTASWKDGSLLTKGCTGYNSGNPNAIPTRYAFPSPPNDPDGWSMCAPNPCTSPMEYGDRRTIQASGPFLLMPGAVNELVIGVPWVPDQVYPCPDISGLFRADDLAQALFDRCFEQLDGPTAPAVDWVELDKSVVAVLTNDDPASNNYHELYGAHSNPSDPKYQGQYNEIDPFAPLEWKDSDAEIAAITYKFEGYLIYQLATPNVSVQEFTNPDKARIAYQVDVKNGVSKIYNWREGKDPATHETVYFPEEQVNGENKGIRHTFLISSDQFGKGDAKKLVNHKKYYFTVLAYAHNAYEPFDFLAKPGKGQQMSFKLGRLGAKTYTVIPRPPLDKVVHSAFGDGIAVTRLEGVGAGGTFLELDEETVSRMLKPNFDSLLRYKPGKGPIQVQIFNPYEVKNGQYELSIVDSDLTDEVVDSTAWWEFKDLQTGQVLTSEKSIAELNEQVLANYGFSISIKQTNDAGDLEGKEMPPQPITTTGVIGADFYYKNGGRAWLAGIPDQQILADRGSILDYLQTEQPSGRDAGYDPYLNFTGISQSTGFAPYVLCDWQWEPDHPYFSPAWSEKTNQLNGSAIGYDIMHPEVRRKMLQKLPNVDIVITRDTSLWSRCIIVETAPYMYSAPASMFPKPDPVDFDMQIEGPAAKPRTMMDTRYAPSVGKVDANHDGLPDPDGAVDAAGHPVTGMGWFPGYAVDVETGRRLNLFFGENSVYQSGIDPGFTGRDMLWNPTNRYFRKTGESPQAYYDYLLGGQHWVYVHSSSYDGCQALYPKMNPDLQGTVNNKRLNIGQIVWAGMPILGPDAALLPLDKGLIPNDVTIRLRVDNPYQTWWNEATGARNGHPRYLIDVRDQATTELDAPQIARALDSIKVVPNPYLAYSEYEASEFENLVKITNLPPKCKVTIFSMDGHFIRQFERAEAYRPYDQINPDLEWDLKNSHGVPVSSGVYLIHIDAGAWGSRTVKWFGVARQFDPSGF